MARAFAYLGKERHDLSTLMRRKGKWFATCSCKRMLDKIGSLERVRQDWRDHIQGEAERLELEPHFYINDD